MKQHWQRGETRRFDQFKSDGKQQDLILGNDLRAVTAEMEQHWQRMSEFCRFHQRSQAAGLGHGTNLEGLDRRDGTAVAPQHESVEQLGIHISQRGVHDRPAGWRWGPLPSQYLQHIAQASQQLLQAAIKYLLRKPGPFPLCMISMTCAKVQTVTVST